MFITMHAAAGAIVGSEINNPIVAFLAGLILHFLMDMIPHGDRELGTRFFGLLNKKINEEEKFKSMALYAVIDGFVTILFLIYFFKNFYFAKDDGVIWAIIGSIIPDLLVALYMVWRSKWLKWLFDFHYFMHYLIIGRLKNDIPLKSGIAMQIIITIFLIGVLWQINLVGPYFTPLF